LPLSVPLCQSQYSPSGPRPRTSPATGYNGKDQRLNSTLATQAEPLAHPPSGSVAFGNLVRLFVFERRDENETLRNPAFQLSMFLWSSSHDARPPRVSRHHL